MLLLALALAAMPLQANGSPLAPFAFDRRRDSEGMVALDLTIAADGALERCAVVAPTGTGRLERAVCDQLRQGRFVPARDGQGAAIPAFIRYRYATLPQGISEAAARVAAATIMNRVKSDFAIPVDRLPATATRPAVGVLLVTGPDGKVADCIVGTTSGSSMLDRLACTTMATTDLTPVRDGDGKPIRAMRELAVGFVVASAAVRP
jgi:TonB family protein